MTRIFKPKLDTQTQKFLYSIDQNLIKIENKATPMLKFFAILITLCLLATPTSFAHHGNVIFDLEKVVTMQAQVNRLVWRNPHVYLYVDVTDQQGEVREWQLEGDATSIMSRSGWSRDVFESGEPVTVRENPDRDLNTAHGLIVSVLKSDGIVLMPRSGGRASSVSANSIEGIWDALRDFKTRRFIYGELTAEGAEAKASYTEADNPVIDCVPFPVPAIVTAPYLFEIKILEDQVRFRTELFNVERNFYTDGRPHPENGELTNQGHSIAWWEGDKLIVDTVNYEYNRTGNRSGVPGGTQKHSIETYELSEDGKQLKVDYVIHDPDFMAEPMTGGIVWDYAPDREFMPFDCNLDNARLYDVE